MKPTKFLYIPIKQHMKPTKLYLIQMILNKNLSFITKI